MAVLWQGAMAQVWPLVEYNPDTSQKLVDAIATGSDVAACLTDPAADVNFAGAIWLKSRHADVVLREEAPNEVQFEYEEIRTDASPLFLAAHSGDLSLVRSLIEPGWSLLSAHDWAFKPGLGPDMRPRGPTMYGRATCQTGTIVMGRFEFEATIQNLNHILSFIAENKGVVYFPVEQEPNRPHNLPYRHGP